MRICEINKYYGVLLYYFLPLATPVSINKYGGARSVGEKNKANIMSAVENNHPFEHKRLRNYEMTADATTEMLTYILKDMIGEEPRSEVSRPVTFAMFSCRIPFDL